jgi:hypothetical protein
MERPIRQVALADLHARTIDHFLHPTADPQVATLVQRGKIAGMQPTISIKLVAVASGIPRYPAQT